MTSRPAGAQALARRDTRQTDLTTLESDLERLSRHNDDAIATAALAGLQQLRTCGPAITAQQFGALYLQVLREQHSLAGSPTAREWRSVRGLCRGVYMALLRQFRRDVRAARAARTSDLHEARHDAAATRRDSGGTSIVPDSATGPLDGSDRTGCGPHDGVTHASA
jgi:hypothetical protein